MFSKEQTPTSEFYVVTKNVFDPPVDVGTWLLSIGGLVSNPTTYSYGPRTGSVDLLAMPTVDELVTLGCVSHEVGGSLISTAGWPGVGLGTFQTRAGIAPTADGMLL